MRKFLIKTGLILGMLFFAASPALAVDMSAKPSPPKNLMGGVIGSKDSDLEVFITWQCEGAGYAYKITRKDESGDEKQFVLQGASIDPNCSGRGGFFYDPLVEKGKTYTYEIRAFMPATLVMSDPAVITILVEAGDLVGCKGYQNIQPVSKTGNFSAKIAFDNPEHKNLVVYKNNKIVAKTTGNEVKIWPIFGTKNEIKVVQEEQKNANNDSLFVSSAKACTTDAHTYTINVEKEYRGFTGLVAKFIDGVIK